MERIQICPPWDSDPLVSWAWGLICIMSLCKDSADEREGLPLFNRDRTIRLRNRALWMDGWMDGGGKVGWGREGRRRGGMISWPLSLSASRWDVLFEGALSLCHTQ